MSDMLAGLGSVLLDGPILALLLAFYSMVLGGICWGFGRRSAFREVDEGQAVVLAACEDAVRERVVLPGQRPESD